MIDPECEHGYPWSQIEREWGEPFAQRLAQWMAGQTMALCDEHGTVVYQWDMRRFAGSIIPCLDNYN